MDIREIVETIYEKYGGSMITASLVSAIKYDLSSLCRSHGIDAEFEIEVDGSTLNINPKMKSSKILPIVEIVDVAGKKKVDYGEYIKDWIFDLGLSSEEARYVENRIRRACRKKSGMCMDNFRLADMDNCCDVWKYEDVRSKGCCGFYDEVIELHSGRRIRFGFNYGH